MTLPPLPHSLPVETIPAGTTLWRIHRKEHGALWFGPGPGQPPSSRFDAPEGEYRTCYLGESLAVAFAETLVRGSRQRVVPLADLGVRLGTPVALARDLRVAALHGPGLVRLSIGAEVVHGFPYAPCQALALSIHAHADAVDGIRYRFRWDNDAFCIALFDRAASRLDTPGAGKDLADPAVTGPILGRYGLGVI